MGGRISVNWKKDNSPRRISRLCFLVLVLFFGCYSTLVFSARQTIVRGDDFILFFETGESLGFQHVEANFTVTVDVASGTLNASNGDLLITSDINRLQGDFWFSSQDSASLLLSCDHEDVKLYLNGYDYTGAFNIASADRIHIRWLLSSNIFVWTLPILGVVGAFCLVASPYYIVTQLRKKTAEALLNAWMYGILLFILGLGLLICWLWS